MVKKSLFLLCGAIASLLLAQPASACMIIWDAQRAQEYSDAIIWGTYAPGDARGQGRIEVSRREKGPKVPEVVIRWNADWVSDGANCPPWQPIVEYPRGRFFLKDNRDGTYSVHGQDPYKKAKK